MGTKTGLNQNDIELANRLVSTGIPKSVALSLAYLLRVRETDSTGIEKATGLRQPEVSIAMQKLRKMEWITKTDIKREGKGRPTHSYTLAVKPAKIYKSIEEGELKKIKEIRDNVKTLRKSLVG